MKIVIAILAFAASAIFASAQHSDISVYLKHMLTRFYLGSVGADFSDGERSLSNDLTISKGNAYAGVWMATGPGPSKYKEDWDPYIGLVHAFGPVRYEVNATYFVLSNQYESRDDLWSLDQKVSPIHRTLTPSLPQQLLPYLKLRAFNKVGSRSFESGWFGWAGCEYKRLIGKSMLDIDASFAYSDGPFGKTPGPVYWRAVVSLARPLAKNVTITPSIIYQTPTRNELRAPKPFVTRDQLVWGFTVGYPLEFRRSK